MIKQWYIKALGSSSGSYVCGKQRGTLAQGKKEKRISLRPGGEPLTLRSESGKLADSNDSLLFAYTSLDPRSRNFYLKVTATVLPSQKTPDYQTGYGIYLADTVASPSKNSVHRNSLSVGSFRLLGGLQHGYGVRVVGGYTKKDGEETGQYRILDPSRKFRMQKSEDELAPGDTTTWILRKNDQGFQAYLEGEKLPLEVAGHDFLMQQDPGKLYVGVMAGGKAAIRFQIDAYEETPGMLAATPAGSIRLRYPEYPFERSLIATESSESEAIGTEATICWAAPQGHSGAAGTREDPWDLLTGIARIQPGQTLILRSGIYHPDAPGILRQKGQQQKPVRIIAEEKDSVVIDGSRIPNKVPLLILKGTYLQVSGIKVCCSRSSGMHICGHHIVVDDCEAYENGDTGILICAYPGDAQALWPSFNEVRNCSSHHNRDTASVNADGFGAKLTCGEGNVFYGCTAHHNVDDGFDLYTKAFIGPIGAVRLEQCTAYQNQNGFKLGGELVAVPHQVLACTARNNRHHGFDINQNPRGTLSHCFAEGNGAHPRFDNYYMKISDRKVRVRWIRDHNISDAALRYRIGRLWKRKGSGQTQ